MQYFVVGDVHLLRDGQRAVARDLAAVVAQQRGRTVVFAGDMLDLAAESVHDGASNAVSAVFGAHPALRQALAAHVGAGGEMVVVAGNHDDELATPEGCAAMCDALGLDAADRARVRATPWFARLGTSGTLHVEHGHHFDPDNALPHPLAPPAGPWSSLGIALMREFIAPMGIHALVHANDATPLQCIARSFELFGARTPVIIARYLTSAALQIARAGRRYPDGAARASGAAVLADFAAQSDLAPDVLEALVARGAVPTLASTRATFLRLYWDRVLPTALLSVAGTSALLGGPGRRVALGAAAVLVASMAFGRNRYRGRVQNSLVDNSEHIVAATGARAVVFGHIHDPVAHGVYKNTGSFAFPGRAPGRPYVVVDDDDRTRHEFYRAPSAA